jgi:transcriptional regulator with GAF, ATPase, and Fis domain/predicted Ser/Thr protein kinase
LNSLDAPGRYEPIRRLGKGGGGEVWAVLDRHTGERLALKVLAADATEGEMRALVREAVTLSGLEGLGVPRVLGFGRLPVTGRPFMVRELVEGTSLQQCVEERRGGRVCLEALAGTAEQATMLHRAGLLHGDIKPANVIVADSGRATLVDLGLAAPWRERGTEAKGLTPKYAAPELFAGKPLTVRAEIYALGVALEDLLDAFGGELPPSAKPELEAVARRATREEPTERFPSADEFASALRRAAGLGEQSQHQGAGAAGTWPIVGIEAASARLLQRVVDLGSGATLRLDGPTGAGRSVLLRRLAWSMGIEGRPTAYVDESLVGNAAAVTAELAEHAPVTALTILVDDAERLPAPALEAIAAARRAGARLVIIGESPLAEGAETFAVTGLGDHAAIELLRRAVPSLTEGILARVVSQCEARPGELRRFVRLVAEQAVVSEADVEELLGGIEVHPGSTLPEDPVARALTLLDRGRLTEARRVLDGDPPGDPLTLAIARARVAIGLGDDRTARSELAAVEAEARQAGGPLLQQWATYYGRAHVGGGAYGDAIAILGQVDDSGPTGAEALAYLGLAHHYQGDDARAQEVLARAVEHAAACESDRARGIALVVVGVVHQRADRSEDARAAYEQAIVFAGKASDASNVGTARLNLAGLLKINGDLAGALENYEGAVDMGRRAGKLGTVRNALLNLANLDLYLGRLARARSGIETLEGQRDAMTAVARAQLNGLVAELEGRAGAPGEALRAYRACAASFEEIGLTIDAAEALLEGVLVGARQPNADLTDLAELVARAEALLGDATAHRSLLSLAKARLSWTAGDHDAARDELGRALAAAREANQADWLWRTLEMRAEVEEAAGERVSARRDREEALSILEGVASRLPRDLREVFWNDPRRGALRSSVERTLGHVATEHALIVSTDASSHRGTSSISSLTSTPLERRLARILEINTELLGEVDLDRLTTRVTDHAVDMLHAERGHVILEEPDGTLTVRTSRARGGRSAAEEFSRSVAEKVVTTGEPVVSINARGDSSLRSFASVHQLMLEAVACVPIRSRHGDVIGALYVETRLASGDTFERELPTLRAFADQVGIAIETAALVADNQRRAAQLEESNEKLERAQLRLRELLGDRTAELKRTKQKLRDARDTLLGHFGYQGLVGTSAAMRRVYALIDRVKDTDVPILITGESGTGKEVVARAIHRSSARAKRPFLGVNCGAIPENLLESELFGHVRGAFTGADRERKGLLRDAEGGTVLLDEIGEMPHKMQAGLLRVLQERRVRPVGGTDELPVDIRLVFATHRNLEAMVEQGTFREDLFYRIHVVEVAIPPLRDRVEDVPPLVDHFLGLFAARYKRERKTVSREALRRLSGYAWPGNVRQLEHVLLNAWVLSDSDVLEPEDFDMPDGPPPARRVEPSSAEPPPRRSAGTTSHSRRQTLSKHKRDEKARIIEALEACNWNRVKAAELSGIPRRTFYRRLRQYGIQ